LKTRDDKRTDDVRHPSRPPARNGQCRGTNDADNKTREIAIARAVSDDLVIGNSIDANSLNAVSLIADTASGGTVPGVAATRTTALPEIREES
jgi:hypothetical protein